MEHRHASGSRTETPAAPPEVSVVIGTYNCARYLPDLFKCLHEQTYRNFEIVVVDDASTDEHTLSFLAQQGERIRLFRREHNSGTCELPRYQGVMHSRGTYCAFLDADDRWDPSFLSKTVAYLKSHPECPLVHTHVRVIDETDQILRIRHEGSIPEGPCVARELLRHCFITASSVVVRREVWLGAVPEEAITDFGMDQDFFVAIAREYPIGFLAEILASYRRSSTSVSVKKWKRIPRNVHTLERLLEHGAWNGIISRREMVKNLVEAYIENAIYWRMQQDRRKACWFGLRGLHHDPLSLRLWKCFLAAVLKTRRTA